MKKMEQTKKTARGERKDFPLTTLIVAEDVARAVNGAGGKISAKAISASLGNIKGGALARKVASAKRWGLIKGTGMLEITPLGKKVIMYLDEKDLAKSRKEAFLTVPLFAELYTRFGNTTPSDQAFVAILVREYDLSERDAKTMLTLYKEATKLYLNAEVETLRSAALSIEESSENESVKEIPPKPKNMGTVSITISSPLGENNLKANNKTELKSIESKIKKLFALIEEDLPEIIKDNSQIGPIAGETKLNLSSESFRDNSEIAN
ncbi:hypothetical protein COU58_01410 [Candidatus Pacearchaeota archaeon CG10_big_fil_rev_8_21_14_0_10_32_42]|nr:MAG: hypothetical protein COU58_01410 [Candidatus Pacearchaeota archaeon CG10_big_fil_rev_8_21_14_0_10_32_42]